MEWRLKASQQPKKSKSQPPRGKRMGTVLWDISCLIQVDFLEDEVTSNAHYYSKLGADVEGKYKQYPGCCLERLFFSITMAAPTRPT
jgi:hypothetical protein